MNREERVVELLIQKGYHISCAESCTGGKLAATLVNVSGASAVLDASFITYANWAKIQYVNVNPETIDTYGVVSEEVAKEMAVGVAKVNHAEVGVGISGIAGPTGATPNKPVGMVCFGISICGNVYTYTKQFGEIGREQVKAFSVEFVLDQLIELLS
jgi:PncC family amidohydrolase